MSLVTITEAAKRLDVSVETVKRRLRRGELQGEQQPRPQGFTWLVEIPDDPNGYERATFRIKQQGSDPLIDPLPDPVMTPSITPTVPPSPSSEAARLEGLVAWLQKELEASRAEMRRQDEGHAAVIAAQERELEARRREVQELHVLLQQVQAALPAPRESRGWWQKWFRK